MGIETRIKVTEAYKTILEFILNEMDNASSLAQWLKRGGMFIKQLNFAEDILEQEDIIHYRVKFQELAKGIEKYKK